MRSEERRTAVEMSTLTVQSVGLSRRIDVLFAFRNGRICENAVRHAFPVWISRTYEKKPCAMRENSGRR